MKIPRISASTCFAAAWFLLVAVRFLFHHEINDRLWVLTLFFDGLLIVAGVALATVLGWKRRRGPLVAALLILGVIGVSWFTPAGRLTGTCFRLWRLESTYQAEVDRILALDDNALDSFKSPAGVSVDPGPPRRIAFSWGGIIDNWTGIVYDPSGEVLKARQFKDDWSNWGDPALADIRSLFGGDLRHATHLWGHWYYCAFT